MLENYIFYISLIYEFSHSLDPELTHSALMLAARMTLPHFSVSSAISFPKSPREPERTLIPRSANRALTTGLARPALIAWLSVLMTSAGVFLGGKVDRRADIDLAQKSTIAA